MEVTSQIVPLTSWSRLTVAVIVAGFLVGAARETGASEDFPPDMEAIVRSVYPSAQQLRVREQPQIGVATVTYVVPMAYPSRAVAEHYASILAGLRWRPDPGDVGADGREWQCFEDGTRDGIPIVHQLLARWVSQDGSRTMILALRYESPSKGRESARCPGEPTNDRQQVVVQINPVGLPDRRERGL